MYYTLITNKRVWISTLEINILKYSGEYIDYTVIVQPRIWEFEHYSFVSFPYQYRKTKVFLNNLQYEWMYI